MAHVAERIAGFYTRINAGTACAYATSIPAVLEEVKEVRPTVFGSVPRIFEKAYAENLITLYDRFEPDVVIVDGNGQEGNGPVRGTPKTTDLVLGADDALKADVVAARIMGISPEEVPSQLAEVKGFDLFNDIEIPGLDPDDVRVDFQPHKRTKHMQVVEGAA